MPRFRFDYVRDNKSLLSLESTEEEDRAEQAGDLVLVGFTSDGYWHFWERCQAALKAYRATHSIGDGLAYAIVTDLWADRPGASPLPS